VYRAHGQTLFEIFVRLGLNSASSMRKPENSRWLGETCRMKKVWKYTSECSLLMILLLASLSKAPAVLAHGDEMEEVVVISARNHRTLDDTPLRVQILGAEELREKANMKPGDIRMMLNESTGIQVQQTSATSFNSSVRIQGLDGRYTQLLRDGLPVYAGFSGSLSLLQIAPLDLKQVEVVKGASSTLYGGGAIAGLINLVSKTPEETPETALMLNATSANGVDVSAFHSSEHDTHGVTLFASYNQGSAYEPADNGISAIPEFERFTFTPRWFYSVSDKTNLDLGVGFITEDRLGGSLEYIDGASPNDYFESNDSTRFYTRFGLAHVFDNDIELDFKSATSWFDRQLATQGYLFSGEQRSSFNELTLAGQIDQASWVMGANVTTEAFDHAQPLTGYDHTYSEHTQGVFAQYTRDLSTLFVVEAGMRVDSHSEYGNFWLPRVSLLFLPAPDITVRMGGGYGYKTPNLFVPEADERQYQDIVPIDPSEYIAEKSRGLNFDINYRVEFAESWSLTSNLLLFYTEIDDALNVTEQDSGQFVFTQQSGATKASGAELNLIFGFGEIRYFLGYTYVDASEEIDTGDQDLALVSQHRVNNVLVWEREDNFRVGLEAYYFSSQRRTGDVNGESYWIYGVMTEKKIGETVTAFLNFENFTDTRQTRFENINTGTLQNPQFRDVYAPLDGFVINGGFRIQW